MITSSGRRSYRYRQSDHTVIGKAMVTSSGNKEERKPFVPA
ncbi:hypothetical protein HMPREF1981_02927 [Bacteroides pyogenes F0041]|uniref:Uncharacterized protein n=1 Tax=Bacteroides pyogenes F0041 TaxID=1321819 RepID=U2DPX7_9BACE|nr:hypothetical protein HMPREF1981_02927 [Bacteroides pyogenes F0041]